MKVTILSKTDFAGSGHKMWEALSRKIDAEIFVGKYRNKYKHGVRNVTGLLDPWDIDRAQRSIDTSDIVHLKGDWPPFDGYMNLRIMHKPVICTVAGSLFRKRSQCGYEKVLPKHFESCALKTAITPDLLYPEFSSTWTPSAMDSSDKKNEWERSDPPIFVHSPSNTAKKGTKFLMFVFEELKKKISCEVVVLRNVSYSKVVEDRKSATIFFDQFKVGFYGNASIEAMQYGIPVANWISPQAFEQAKGQLSGCPVITAENTVEAWVDKIIQVLESDMEDLSRKTKEWCEKWHSYESFSERWINLYNTVA